VLAVSVWLRVAAVVAAATILILVWRIMFRSVMRHPTNGNEFSENNISG
jgi:hypothetical protein